MNNNVIHPSALVGENVQLGTGISIGPNAVILGPAIINDDVWVGANSVIGAPPEIANTNLNLAWDREIAHEGVVIESHAVVREGVVIHQGSIRTTVIGEGALILNRSYIAHDTKIGSSAVISAGVSVGGHCVIGSFSNLGMNASVHQKTIIGAGAMVGMSTPVVKNVPPFSKVYGSPIRLAGANSFLLAKKGFTENEISAIQEIYCLGFGDLPEAWEKNITEVLSQRIDLSTI